MANLFGGTDKDTDQEARKSKDERERRGESREGILDERERRGESGEG